MSPAPADPQPSVRGGGGILTRPGAGGGTEIMLVHRPKYDDWSLPKGKAKKGESLRDTAVREVTEETGVVPRVITALGATRYIDHRSRPKTVWYWLMEPTDETGHLEPDVDVAVWMDLEQAITTLSYSHDMHFVVGVAGRLAASVGAERETREADLELVS